MRTEVRRGERRVAAARVTKFVGVSDRQVRVVASDATPDRMGDVLDPNGVQLANYRRNPVVLFGHDPLQPIARCTIGVEGNAVVATITFPEPGVSEKSDEVLRLLKAGILSAVSVGFQPLEWEPIRGAGLRFTKWELLELSVVSVPANPSAVVTERSMRKGSRPVQGDDTEAQLARVRRAAELQRSTSGLATVRLGDDRPADAHISPAEAKEHVALLRARHGLKRLDPRVVAAQSQFRIWGN
jgi:HK97 family phage prohead protease